MTTEFNAGQDHNKLQGRIVESAASATNPLSDRRGSPEREPNLESIALGLEEYRAGQKPETRATPTPTITHDEKDGRLPLRGPICDNKTSKAQRLAARGSRGKRVQRLIDSRSILNNKEKLKRFWEGRMEMEFKARAGKPGGLGSTTAAATITAKLDNRQVLQANTTTTNGEPNVESEHKLSGSQIRAETLLSENATKGNFDENNNADEYAELVSAELICEKLRAANHQLQHQEPHRRPQLASRRAKQEVTGGSQQPMSINPALCHFAGEGDQRQEVADLVADEPLISLTAAGEDSEEQSANEEFSSSSSSFGPMSISVVKPTTLSQETPAEDKQVAVEAQPSSPGAANGTRAPAENGRNPVEEDGREDEDVREEEEDEEEEEEEEEETSTQSGSVLTVICNGNNNNNSSNQSTTTNQQRDSKTSDRPGAAAAAAAAAATAATSATAAPSLITSIEDQQDATDDDGRAGEQQLNVEEQDSDGSNIGVAFESLQFDDEIKSSRNELVDETRLLTNDHYDGTRSATKAQPALRFAAAPDKCKKSLLRNPAATSEQQQGNHHDDDGDNNNNNNNNHRPMPKFNSREVKSVCSFITNAISDATRQVDDYIIMRSKAHDGRIERELAEDAHGDKSDDEAGGDADGEYDEVADGIEPSSRQGQRRFRPVDGFQRATFVHESPVGCGTSSRVQPRQDRRDELERTFNKTTDLRGAPNGRASSSGDDEGVEDDDDDDEDEDEEEEDFHYGANEQPEVPRADLSSIFEANVRREIERFESNTTQRRDANGLLGGNKPGQQCASSATNQTRSGLTEWRIAEEIRLFNERENELKQRSSGSQKQVETYTKHADEDKPVLQQQLTESVVRFGKTLRIPKHSQVVVDKQAPVNNHQLSRSIKLSTSTQNCSVGAQSQPPTMISMHKFISSGGKKFVYQTSNSPQIQTSGSRQHTDAPMECAAGRNQLTKSMSNLSSLSTASSALGVALSRPVVDYRAVDSLRCKEVPNVEPGLTKKTIETFSRLTSEPLVVIRQDHGGSAPSMEAARAAEATNFQQRTLVNKNRFEAARFPNKVAPSAEWKIQEELREMKAREAELRNLRNQQSHSKANEHQPRRGHPQVEPVESVSDVVGQAGVGENGSAGGKQASQLGKNQSIAGGEHKSAGQIRTSARRARRASANADDQAETGHAEVALTGNDEGQSDDARSSSDSECVITLSKTLQSVSAAAGCKLSSSNAARGLALKQQQQQSLRRHNPPRPAATNDGAESPGRDGSRSPDAADSHSLYPIKQTIDSFRKLNASTELDNNNQQQRQVLMTRQMERSGKKQTPPPPLQGKQQSPQQRPKRFVEPSITKRAPSGGSGGGSSASAAPSAARGPI